MAVEIPPEWWPLPDGQIPSFAVGLRMPADGLGTRHVPWQWVDDRATTRTVVCGAAIRNNTTNDGGPSCPDCARVVVSEAVRLAAITGMKVA